MDNKYNKSKKLVKSVAIALNDDLINQINEIKIKAYDKDLSFSAVVRKILEKGMIEVKKEIEEKEKIRLFYEQSLKKE